MSVNDPRKDKEKSFLFPCNRLISKTVLTFKTSKQKKTMKTLLITLLATSLLWSCTKDSNEPSPIPPEEGDGAKIALAFIDSDLSGTRAFGNNAATNAEKKVVSAKIFIFQSGVKIFEKLFTSAELTNVGTSPITFNVPGMTAGTAYTYYMIINNGDVMAANQSALGSVTMSDVASYNGAWSAVNDGVASPSRSGGFVMHGTVNSTTTADLTQTQIVSITVKRITAKMDITTTIDNASVGPGTRYTGTISVDSTVISKTQTSTPLLPGTPSTSAGTLILAKQLPNVQTVNTVYQNRFYLFENGALTAGSRVLLTLYGTYTNDGMSTPVVYTTELSTDNTGAIVRNGSYVINLTIKGLTGAPLSVSITLGDWESIVTQSNNLGS